MHRLNARFPRRVLLWPVAVQGERAAAEIAAAITGFNSGSPGFPKPDLIIVARGGGSIEDLMAFNEEAVVRAAASCPIPLISAVGHETDTTLIDFAADRRAPTPTAAAEMAVPVRAELRRRVQEGGQRLIIGLERFSEQRSLKVQALARGLGDPQRLVQQHGQRLDERGERLDIAARRFVADRRARVAAARPMDPKAQMILARQHLKACGERLDGGLRRIRGLAEQKLQHDRTCLDQFAARLDAWRLQFPERPRQRLNGLARLLESYTQEPLKRGYALVRDFAGNVVSSVNKIAPGDRLELTFADGSVTALAEGGAKDPSRSAAKERGPAKEKQKAGQGSLF
jgi:exodeoxyribonuclease VII large subunit